jgi:hypothetical protein
VLTAPSAQAFLAASLKTDAELLKWFRDRLVWNEPETVVDLLKNGLFVRLYEPQVRRPIARSCELPDVQVLRASCGLAVRIWNAMAMHLQYIYSSKLGLCAPSGF